MIKFTEEQKEKIRKAMKEQPPSKLNLMALLYITTWNALNKMKDRTEA